MKLNALRIKLLMSRIIMILIIYVLFTGICFMSSLLHSKYEKGNWIDWQLNHIEKITTAYDNGTATKVDESSFTQGFTLEEEIANGTKINQLKYMATHNSYKTGLNAASKFLYHYPLFYIFGTQYDYVFDALTTQLNKGIRSFELDPNYIKKDGKYTVECVHSDLTETNSTMVNFELGLEEIKMWMDYNPNHLPLTILLEPKGAASYSEDAVAMYNDIIIRVFGDKLITPETMLGEYADFDELRADDGYPTLEESQGKIIFLLHEKPQLAEDYFTNDNMDALGVLFPLVGTETLAANKGISKFTCYAIHNEILEQNIVDQLALTDNYIVRTRLDSFQDYSDEKLAIGVDCGANILSTDYPPTDIKRYSHTSSFGTPNKTILLRDKT